MSSASASIFSGAGISSCTTSSVRTMSRTRGVSAFSLTNPLSISACRREREKSLSSSARKRSSRRPARSRETCNSIIFRSHAGVLATKRNHIATPMADALTQPCPKCGTLVDVTTIEPLARVACPNCGEKFRVERAFDNFTLIETLGVGGMGSVYKARDTRLERFVALKLLRKELSADPTEAARLEQEARLTAAVNHPNVVQVYSSGTDHGQIYLVMELVDHGSLDDLMAQQTKLPEQQVLEAGIQVAKGLEAAHERGLIHRDVKPANILFSQKQTAKIGDFGLAVAAEHNAEAQREIWGTPYYVAPERLDNAPEDFRSDIYSLGATLFHAIAGKPPMEGETTSASELRKLKAKPPGLRSVAPKVSRETARVIDKMIAPDPANRYASYAELIQDLQRAYEGNAPRQKRSPVRIIVIAIVALLGVGEAGMYLFSKRKGATAASTSKTPAA